MCPLGEYPVLLQKAPVKIIDTNTCNAQEAYDGVIQDTMLCAGYMEGTIDACQVSPGIIHNDHIVYYQLIFYVDYQYESNSVLQLI